MNRLSRIYEFTPEGTAKCICCEMDGIIPGCPVHAPTPETDAEEWVVQWNEKECEVVDADFARKLERHRNAAIARPDAAEARVKKLEEALDDTISALNVLKTFHRNSPTWKTCEIDKTIKEAFDLLL